MLNLDGKLQRCVYGDKEIFWLGQLYAGQDYSINPVDGSIIDLLMKSLKMMTDIKAGCTTFVLRRLHTVTPKSITMGKRWTEDL
ncbi:AVN_HP_G0119660.mRNA.1.CDS.1 [Saccharomyces cerevisiae]|nr:AVN_HP_G0119660.mRNA.1.CDS.1 [Saccharomyces cerevisiae]CAI6996791.1 AVN_HP_G0119660.mRNA.1.CDS.1 [Saccharomyces cerevisiae]